MKSVPVVPLSPHIRMKKQGKAVNSVVVEKEWSRSRTCDSGPVRIESDDRSRYPQSGAKTCQCSYRISVTSLEALATGHPLSNDRLFCSSICLANFSGSTRADCFCQDGVTVPFQGEEMTYQTIKSKHPSNLELCPQIRPSFHHRPSSAARTFGWPFSSGLMSGSTLGLPCISRGVSSTLDTR